MGSVKEDSKVVFYVWKPNGEEYLLAHKIKDSFEKIIDKYESAIIIDLYSNLIVDYKHFAFVFGKAINFIREIDDYYIFKAPSLESMLGENAKENKEKTFELLKELKEKISLKDKQEHTSFVETPNNITVGIKSTDIIISPEEAQHLKNIRDILGGGKIIITKGDLRIEVENGSNGKD